MAGVTFTNEERNLLLTSIDNSYNLRNNAALIAKVEQSAAPVNFTDDEKDLLRALFVNVPNQNNRRPTVNSILNKLGAVGGRRKNRKSRKTRKNRKSRMNRK